MLDSRHLLSSSDSRRKPIHLLRIAPLALFALCSSALAAPPSEYCLVATYGGFGTAPGQFNEPRSMAMSEQFIYVADKNNHRVQVFDKATFKPVSQWGSFDSDGTGKGTFDEPGNVAVDQEGNVYVAEHGQYHRIQKFSADGEFLLQWGSMGTGIGELNKPRGLAVDGQGRVYVSERDNNRVQVFDGDGNSLNHFGSGGTGPGEFDEAMDISIANDGTVYVVDRENDRVERFASFQKGLGFELAWGGKGDGEGEFDYPRGVDVDDRGDVYVTDMRNGRVQVFDEKGEFRTSFGHEIAWKDVHFPLVGPDGAVYISDDHFVRKFVKGDCD